MIQLPPEEKFFLLESNTQWRVSILMLLNKKRGCGESGVLEGTFKILYLLPLHSRNKETEAQRD